jgi:hypothetical protein
MFHGRTNSHVGICTPPPRRPGPALPHPMPRVPSRLCAPDPQKNGLGIRIWCTQSVTEAARRRDPGGRDGEPLGRQVARGGPGRETRRETWRRGGGWREAARPRRGGSAQGEARRGGQGGAAGHGPFHFVHQIRRRTASAYGSGAQSPSRRPRISRAEVQFGGAAGAWPRREAGTRETVRRDAGPRGVGGRGVGGRGVGGRGVWGLGGGGG